MKVDIGDYYTYCCELDLSKVSDEDEKNTIQEELDEGNELGIYVWKTAAEVLDFYKYSTEIDKIKEKLTP